jgi:AcrR family transcriptional regulator
MATATRPAGEGTAERLLVTARAMLDETGVEGLSLRAIARRAGVSHGAPLRHIPTQATLLAAVGAQGFRDLITAVDAHLAALPAGATSLERLSAAGRAYVHFAIANPGDFTVMFSPDRIDQTDPVYLAAAADSFQQLQDVVEAAQHDGFHSEVDPTRLASVMWTSIHGLADLWVRAKGLPGCDESFGLEEFVALSHVILLGIPAEAVPET